jgi:hypothetical protein
MRKFIVIFTSLILTALNVDSYGELDSSVIENSKSITFEQNEENILTKSINWGFGSTVFKLIHFAELMFISEISRKKISQ